MKVQLKKILINNNTVEKTLRYEPCNGCDGPKEERITGLGNALVMEMFRF